MMNGVASPAVRPLIRAVGAGAAVAAGILLLSRSIDAASWLTPEGLRAALGVGRWYAPVGYVSTIVGAMFLPVPKAVLLGLGGVLFGPWYGFAYAWMGQVLGMSVLFVVARSGLRGLVRRLVHERLELAGRLDGHLATRGMWTVACLRLFYFMGTPLSVALATTRLRLRDFVLGTGLGVIPAVALAVVSGEAVATGATGATAALLGAAVVLVLGAGAIVRRRLGL
jgi:uncharacterized membrane protein YdjX (TVP38/TMEM64 family)